MLVFQCTRIENNLLSTVWILKVHRRTVYSCLGLPSRVYPSTSRWSSPTMKSSGPCIDDRASEIPLTGRSEFNEIINMTADELEKWLKEEQSQESGIAKDDGSETVGHER